MPEITDCIGRRRGYVKDPPFDKNDLEQIIALHPQDSLVATLARELAAVTFSEDQLDSAHQSGREEMHTEIMRSLHEHRQCELTIPLGMRPGDFEIFKEGHKAALEEFHDNIKNG